MTETIDLFAGCGGLSLGLEWAGFNTALAVESDKWAAESYAANFKEARVLCRDIREIPNEEIRGLIKCRPTLVCGGPPCQGFSHSNVANRDPKDPRNSLFREFIRWVEVIEPTICLIENVRGLLTARTECGSLVIDVITQEFNRIGYASESRLLDAQLFGVPQKRERVFIVAVKRNGSLRPSEMFPVPTHSPVANGSRNLFDNAENSAVSLWEAISDLPQQTWKEFDPDSTYLSPPINDFQKRMRDGADARILNHEPMRHTERIVKRFEQITYGQSEDNLPEEFSPMRRGDPSMRSGKRYSQNSRRQHPDVPCNTIVASSHTNFIHPFLHRNFTVREMMRIQSIPDAFELRGKRAVLSKKLSLKKGLSEDVYLDQRMQVGNAVPPLLARAFGAQFAMHLAREGVA